MQINTLAIAKDLTNLTTRERQAQAIVTITMMDDLKIGGKTGCGDLFVGFPEQFTPLFQNLIAFKYTDVDIQMANNAHNGTSWSPERRGYLYADDYVQEMSMLDEHFSQFVTDDNRAELVAALEAYRQGYLQRMNAFLHAHSRVMSAMVTGPSRFPTARNQKRGNSADRRRDEWLTWCKETRDRLERRFNPVEQTRVISSDDEHALDKLRAKLAALEACQEKMKAGNKIARNGKKTTEEKVTELSALLNIPPAEAVKLLAPQYSFEKPGFQGFALSNNAANIKRVKDRIAELERKAQDVTAEHEIGKVTVVDNVEANRVQVHFPEKPSREMCQMMRHSGFVWSPSNTAWQRKRSDVALRLAQEAAQKYTAAQPA